MGFPAIDATATSGAANQFRMVGPNRALRLSTLAAAAICACSTGAGGGTTWGDAPWGDGGGTGGDSSDAGGSSTGDGTGTGGTDREDTGAITRFDVAPGMETAGPDGSEKPGCGQVDFLFVIDSSGSMEDEQINLIESFPEFIGAITDTLTIDNFHIMVTETGGSSPGFDCGFALGSGKRGGWVSDTEFADECGIVGPQRYILPGQPHLHETFACIARVGIEGNGDERPAWALRRAITDHEGPGMCNEGFLRPHALLVVVIITDEEDDHETDGSCYPGPPPDGSEGEPPDWYQTVVDAKGGNADNVVVLSLVGPTGPTPAVCPPLNKCGNPIDGAEPSPRLIEFTQMFPRHRVGRICADSYVDFFLDAVGVVETACDEFLPPG